MRLDRNSHFLRLWALSPLSWINRGPQEVTEVKVLVGMVLAVLPLVGSWVMRMAHKASRG